jgi:hypothetical protein
LAAAPPFGSQNSDSTTFGDVFGLVEAVAVNNDYFNVFAEILDSFNRATQRFGFVKSRNNN